VWAVFFRGYDGGLPFARLRAVFVRQAVLACALMSFAAFGPSAAAAVKIKHVLAIYSYDRLEPPNVEIDSGFREALAESDLSAEVDAEFLDMPGFDTEASQSAALVTFLRAKYPEKAPDVIIAAGEEAIDFMLRNRSKLFPLTPIVHEGVASWFLRQELPLPEDVVGVTVDYDFSATIEQALQWRRQARRLVVVTGASSSDQLVETELRNVVSRLKERVTVEFFDGLSTSVVLKRLGQLGDDAVVFTPGYFRDGEGRSFTPRESASLMATAATAPVFGPFDTFMGTGIVGGRMPNYRAMGRQTGVAVSRILNGETAASLHLPEATPLTLNVDWRQLGRWGISESSLPRDTIVQFRQPTLWETHPKEVALAAVLFSILTLLVAGLLIERRQRRLSELTQVKLRNDLARAMRLAIAGELTGAIAHEINQPLGAILNNVAAADLMLQSGLDRRDDLRAILSDIRRDNLRATEVIRRLRALFTLQKVEQTPFKIGEAVNEVAIFLRAEAQRRRIALDFSVPLADTTILGDRTAIAQMLMNLVLNSMEALADAPEDRRSTIVSADTVENGNSVLITVRDRGRGINPEQLPKLFDSFFTTKRGGMGMGLSIVRTILQAHSGKVWAENGHDGGATFYVQLPAMSAEMERTDAA
jgi:signal transduction histidine kinase